ncbi:MAG: hypothetical protein PHT33_11150 [bacterium]|nr:hypothetical protein [bacterium]
MIVDDLLSSVSLACDWLVDVAQVREESLGVEMDSKGYRYDSWKGAIRGEYHAGKREWDFFCPVWHTGQAIKALLQAAKALNEERYRSAALLAGEFILDKQIWRDNHPDHGLILAFEDFPDKVNVSAVLECLDGLIALAEGMGSSRLWKRIETAVDFLIERTYMPAEGLFRDVYDPALHALLLPNPYRSKASVGGRPLIDDAVFMSLYKHTGKTAYSDIHLSLSETLLRDQNPPGNWLDYGPNHADTCRFHPRSTYWWALPLLETYRETGRPEFLETVMSAGEFCRQAMRHDGGWIRGLYVDPATGSFNTDSFGHATSGTACAAILFMELFKSTGDEAWMEDAGKAVMFCRRMQFTSPEDTNLRGAILEKVLPPDGSDRSPYHIRDLGTIFYVIAALEYYALVS